MRFNYRSIVSLNISYSYIIVPLFWIPSSKYLLNFSRCPFTSDTIVRKIYPEIFMFFLAALKYVINDTLEVPFDILFGS